MQGAAYIWAKVIHQLEERLGAIAVSAWLDDADVVALNDKNLIIHTPSDFRQEHILRSCKPHIDEILQEVCQQPITLLVWGDSELEKHRHPEKPEHLWKINPHFNFENFVADPRNRVPLKAAIHIAESEGDCIYNPLYYYGPPGVGKTHLLYAIANKIAQTNPAAKIVYIKGDQFTNELVQAIRFGTTIAFKKKYREADVLLVDDIQFIAGKDSTQEEFFHTFNNLYEMRKQIVLTSDRAPRDMPLLEERLKGRFGEGMMVKIEPPDLETRKKIIGIKASQLHLSLGDEVIDYLSEKLCENVRQIEGGLRKISAFKDLSNMPLTLQNIAQTIADLHTDDSAAGVSADTIARYVCKYFGIEEAQLKGPDRSRSISEPRQLAIYLIRELTGATVTEIGEYFNRNHGTICTSIKKVEALLAAKDRATEDILSDIRMNIEANT